MIKTEMWLKVKVDNIKTLYQIIKYVESLENTSITIEQSKTEQVNPIKIKFAKLPTNSRQTNDKTCPKCGKDLVQKEGKYGPFLGCSGFKDGCKYIGKVE